MSYQFTISDIGLRLIKAYEGFIPESQALRDGRNIVGYGHITHEKQLHINENDAETLLKDDLRPIEALINNNVHAAMTQSQFDALCSLTHSIGTAKFLKSDILHALNKGEIITAANGFDAWRLGKVDDQIYIVDALVRRRTAEKALFLRPTVRTVPAPKQILPAHRDDIQGSTQASSQQSLRKTTATPLNTQTDMKLVTPYMEPEDNSDALNKPSVTSSNSDIDNNIIELTELADPIDTHNASIEASITAAPIFNDGENQSPIAEAAAEVSERLDALMEKDQSENTSTWPQSLINNKTENHSTHKSNDHDSQTPNLKIIDNLAADDALRGKLDDGTHNSADRYITFSRRHKEQNIWAFITMIITGLTLAGIGVWHTLKGSAESFGELGPLISSSSVILGALLSLMGIYYLSKHIFGRK